MIGRKLNFETQHLVWILPTPRFWYSRVNIYLALSLTRREDLDQDCRKFMVLVVFAICHNFTVNAVGRLKVMSCDFDLWTSCQPHDGE